MNHITNLIDSLIPADADIRIDFPDIATILSDHYIDHYSPAPLTPELIDAMILDLAR